MLAIYLHLHAEQRRNALQRAAAAVAPCGSLLIVGHHTDNLTQGFGGPRSPQVFYTEDDILADLAEFPDLVPRTAQRVERMIDGQPRTALDVVVDLKRSAAGARPIL